MIFQDSLGAEISNHRLVIVYLQSSFKGIRLVNHSIYSLDKDQEINNKLQSVSRFIEDFKKENRIGNINIFTGIPDDLVIYKEIIFPIAVKENLRSAIGYEMEKHIPLKHDDIYYDFQILEEDKENNQLKILLIIAKKEAVDPYVNFARSLPGGVSGIEASSVSLSNFFSFVKQDGSSRSLENTPRFFHSNKQAFLSLFSQMEKNIISKTGILSQEPVPAFALALKGLWNVPFNINLLPPEYRKKPGRAGYYVMTALAVIIILSALAWGGSSVIRRQMAVNEINTEINRLGAEIIEIDKMQDQINNIENRINNLKSLSRGYVSLSDIMRELAQILPETAWIRDFNLTEQGIQITGNAESASELIGIIEASPLFKDAAFLSTIVKEKENKERFSIGFKAELVSE
ncbi:Type IV pilus assembly protein, PilM and PilN domains-containing [Desulfonema limicola]|uniref:Type IV pilus assembly protein, PilM and PilN domains-containing n=1 Tax=Desulfonema limicola TaxID=45656 RepID=A0A975B8G8_9BACT|nr:PilN domain-containing protein [Desulfonema limicola]QTA80616.1 Type IV pilus assembly protein, PilM and PilN domains-containing [Desulfonema limicola]